MTRVLGIEIAGDYNSTAIKEATAGVETFGRTVNDAATKNIERLTAQRVKLQELAGEYRALAGSAKAGSAEQVAALDLAARAQKRLGTEVLATNAVVRSSARDTAASVALSEREISKFARGAAVSGGAGRAAALSLGSTGFLLGAGAGVIVKKSIDDAKALMDAQEQLAVAARNVGISLDHKQLDDYLAAESKLSLFTKADLTASLVGLVRATGSVAQAQTDATLAANIARATGKDLASVTQGIIALEGGRTRSLVQLGVKIPVVKTATDALTASGLKFTGQQRAEAAALDKAATAAEGKRILLQRYHGASEAYAKSDAAATDKLREAENQLSTSIGTVLLPVVKQIADPFAKWAEKEASSGDAAKKTKEIVGDLTGVLKDAKAVIHDVDGVTGSFKNTLELLIGLKVASMFVSWTSKLTLFGDSFSNLMKLELPAAVAGFMANPEIAGFLAVLGGVEILSKMTPDKTNTGGMPAKIGGHKLTSGSAGEGYYVGKNVIDFDPKTGTWYEADAKTNAGGHNITPAQAAAALGVPVSKLPGGRTGGGGGRYDNHPANQGTDSGSGVLYGKPLTGEDPKIVTALSTLAAAGYRVDVTSGKRTDAQQAALYNRYAGSGFNIKYIAAKAISQGGPGSNHERGTAVDVYVNGKPVDQTPGALALLKKYGLVSDVAGDHEHLDLVGSGGGGDQSQAAAIAALIAGGKTKHKKPKAPTILHGSALIDSGLLDTLTADKNNAADSTGSVAAMWLHREKADLEKARADVAAKLKGASGKQKTAIEGELRTIDTQIAGVNKSITTNLKAQATAIKANASAAISTAKANISSAFGQIITDAQSAFSKETQDYIDNVLSAKYLQGTDSHGMKLQTANEKKLSDMQAADTASQLQDALTQAKQQLTDDTTGALLEHVVDITTGATKDIFGPAGTSAQKSLDQKAIDAAQRALDENSIAIDAAKERAQEDYDYAAAVKDYQQARTLAEADMVRSLNLLEKKIEDGTGSIGDLNGILDKFGVSLTDVPTPQLADDFGALGDAVQSLIQIMLDEAAALAKIGDTKDSDAAAAAAKRLRDEGFTYNPNVSIDNNLISAGLLPPEAGNSYFGGIYGNPGTKGKVVALDTGADILRDGFAYLHAGERVQSAEVARGSGAGGGGMTIYVTVDAPNYVGSHAELAGVLKSPAIVEAVSTAVLMGNRRGHIRANQLT